MGLCINNLLYVLLKPVQDSIEWNRNLFNRSPPPRRFSHLLLRTALPSVSLREHRFTGGGGQWQDRELRVQARSYRTGIWANFPEVTHWTPAPIVPELRGLTTLPSRETLGGNAKWENVRIYLSSSDFPYEE